MKGGCLEFMVNFVYEYEVNIIRISWNRLFKLLKDHRLMGVYIYGDIAVSWEFERIFQKLYMVYRGVLVL